MVVDTPPANSSTISGTTKSLGKKPQNQGKGQQGQSQAEIGAGFAFVHHGGAVEVAAEGLRQIHHLPRHGFGLARIDGFELFEPFAPLFAGHGVVVFV